ncbi:MAG: hypothetical protein OHK0056_10000 [Bacteriovoracaceae bacterium]
MLKQQPPQECKACIENEYSATQQRLQFQRKFEKDWDQISHHLSQDGSLSQPPQSLDYRSNNICNLACRTCNSGQSSTIRALEEKVLDKKSDSKEINQIISNEYESLIERNKITDLYFANGEPFLSPIFLKTIDKIKSSDFIQEMNLTVTSNLTIYNDQIEEILKLEKKMASFNLIISIDGYLEDSELIREGLNWNVWKENLDRLLSFFPKNKIQTNITVTLPALKNLPKLVRFLKQRQLSFQFSHLIEPEPMTSILRCRGLPKSIINPILTKTRSDLTTDDHEVAELLNFIEDQTIIDGLSDEVKLEYLVSFSRQICLDRVKKSTRFKEMYQNNFPQIINNFIHLNINSPSLASKEDQIRRLFDFNYYEDFKNLGLTLVVAGQHFRTESTAQKLIQQLIKTESKEIVIFILETRNSIFSRFLNFKNKQNLSFEKIYFSKIESMMKQKSYKMDFQRQLLTSQLSYFTKLEIPKFIQDFIENTLLKFFPRFFSLHAVTKMEFRRD